MHKHESHSALPAGPGSALVNFSSPVYLHQAEEMINEIRSAFKHALDRLSWMDDQTRQAAKDKVHETSCSLTKTVTCNKQFNRLELSAKSLKQFFFLLSLQADAIYDMIGFPEFILDSKELDDVYDGVSDGCRSSQMDITGTQLMRLLCSSTSVQQAGCCPLLFNSVTTTSPLCFSTRCQTTASSRTC